MKLVDAFRKMVLTVRRNAAEAAYQSFKDGDYSDLSGSGEMEQLALEKVQGLNRKISELNRKPVKTSSAPGRFVA